MASPPAALLVATMDTKGQEANFIAECLTRRGIKVCILDAGIRGESPVPVAVAREEVALAGGMSLEEVRTIGHEGKALAVMCAGAERQAQALHRSRRISGNYRTGWFDGNYPGHGGDAQFSGRCPQSDDIHHGIP